MLLYIDWSPSEILCHLGPLPVRWYALAWVVGVLLAYLLAGWIYRREGVDPVRDRKGKLQSTGKFDPLVIYCFIGVLVGARLGHCLFYEPAYYLGSFQGVVEMVLPVEFTADGSLRFAGYAGLASHGGVIGMLLALLLYAHHTKLPAWWVLDVIGVVAGATATCIRLGNLMNSEIIGKVADVPWAFLFHSPSALVNGQLVPRHPAQLYEALAYAIILLITIIIYRRGKPRLGTGFYFGFCLATTFTFRFFIEFLKEVQGGADDGSTLLDMGQMLSIPVVIAGLVCMVRGKITSR